MASNWWSFPHGIFSCQRTKTYFSQKLETHGLILSIYMKPHQKNGVFFFNQMNNISHIFFQKACKYTYKYICILFPEEFGLSMSGQHCCSPPSSWGLWFLIMWMHFQTKLLIYIMHLLDLYYANQHYCGGKRIRPGRPSQNFDQALTYILHYFLCFFLCWNLSCSHMIPETHTWENVLYSFTWQSHYCWHWALSWASSRSPAEVSLTGTSSSSERMVPRLLFRKTELYCHPEITETQCLHHLYTLYLSD